ncbi:MAG: hypothetical protein LBU53_10040 [Zoogloeaceae bacterium]|jgi:hypothetical protein|nr:hypothetical protein [Zoogloeaceae bacterium]
MISLFQWIRLYLISSVAFLLVGCASAQFTEANTPTSEIRVVTLPPTAKSVIGTMFLSAKVPLSISSSCHGVGTDFLDATIGAYLSGFLVELNDPDGHNYVQVEIMPEEQAGERGWLANVWMGKAQEEEVWKWGIEFFIRARDGIVVPTSYRCIGTG